MIKRLREQYPIQELCRLFNISRSTLYYNFKRSDKFGAENQQVKTIAASLFYKSRNSIGARRLSEMLRKRNFNIGRYKAGKLMKEAGLVCKLTPKHVYKNGGLEHKLLPNILNRRFKPQKPNQVWCGDITYLRTGNRWLYLAVVLDLYARRIVGWAFSESPDSKLTARALTIAYEARARPKNLIFHSDQGAQYTSEHFQSSIEDYKITQSMSRKGNCWDNSPIERFFRSLKSEWMPKRGYEDMKSAKQDLLPYLTHYYNRERLHSFNSYATPVQKEENSRRNRLK